MAPWFCVHIHQNVIGLRVVGTGEPTGTAQLKVLVFGRGHGAWFPAFRRKSLRTGRMRLVNHSSDWQGEDLRRGYPCEIRLALRRLPPITLLALYFTAQWAPSFTLIWQNHLLQSHPHRTPDPSICCQPTFSAYNRAPSSAWETQHPSPARGHLSRGQVW